MKYRRKSEGIDALQYTGTNIPEIREFVAPSTVAEADAEGGRVMLVISPNAIEGVQIPAFPGDWIVKDPPGKNIPFTDRSFLAEYEPVTEETP